MRGVLLKSVKYSITFTLLLLLFYPFQGVGIFDSGGFNFGNSTTNNSFIDNSSSRLASNPSTANSNATSGEINFSPTGINVSAQDLPQPSTNPTKRPTYSEDGKTLIDQNNSQGINQQTFYLGADKEGNMVENTPRDDSPGLNPLKFETKDGKKQSAIDVIDSSNNVLSAEKLEKLGYVEGESCTTTSNSPIVNRRIGICQDGIYTIKTRETDTAGNKGEIISKEIERDTTSPFKPNLNVGKTGDIFGEFLSINLEGEGEAKVEIRIIPSDTGAVTDYNIFLDKNGKFSSSSFLSLNCGEVTYTIKARVIDRAGNVGEFSKQKSITTLPCPTCSASGSGIFAMPLGTAHKTASFSSDYPIRRIKQNYNAPHAGVDFATPSGTPVYASFDGTVKRAIYSYPNKKYTSEGWGNVVILVHDVNGVKYQTIYAHLQDRRVLNQGDNVSKGQLIGYTGESGKSTGPHLHYQVEKEGASLEPELARDGVIRWNMRYPVDPKKYLGEVKGTIPEELQDKYCNQKDYGDTDFAGYPEVRIEDAYNSIAWFIDHNLGDNTILENNRDGYYIAPKWDVINKGKDREPDKSNIQIIKDFIQVKKECDIWYYDLQSIYDKSGDKDNNNGRIGNDGIIVVNPYPDQNGAIHSYLIKDRHFEKYLRDDKMCGIIGVPRSGQDVAGVNIDSKALQNDQNSYQFFERGKDKSNAIYSYQHREQSWNPFSRIIRETYFIVKDVAKVFHDKGGTWSEYGFPTGDTYPGSSPIANPGNQQALYCKQWFEFNKEIDICEQEQRKINSDIINPKNIEKIFQVNVKNSVDPSLLMDGVEQNTRNVWFDMVNDYETASYDGESEVIILIHGWANDPSSVDPLKNYMINDYGSLANSIKRDYQIRGKKEPVILGLNWLEASTACCKPLGVKNAAFWIKPVAREAALKLKEWGLNDSQNITIIGHSLGSLVAREIAVEYGRAGHGVLLDPPSQLTVNGACRDTWGYDIDGNTPGFQIPQDPGDNDPCDSNTNYEYFKSAFNYSRAYTGSLSIAGNIYLAASSHESFFMEFEPPCTGTGCIGEEHFEVIQAYNKMLTNSRLANDLLTLGDRGYQGKYREINEESARNRFDGTIWVDEDNSSSRDNPQMLATTKPFDPLTRQIWGTEKPDTFKSEYLQSYYRYKMEIRGEGGRDTFETPVLTKTESLRAVIQDFNNDRIRLYTEKDSNNGVTYTQEGYNIKNINNKPMLNRRICGKKGFQSKTCSDQDLMVVEGVGYEELKSDLAEEEDRRVYFVNK
jgi:pimeloyl-ACP methyl ester carboxylesterase